MRQRVCRAVLAGCVLAATLPSPARAADKAEAPPHVSLPEPVLGESVTDIDATEAGELEVDATGLLLRGSRDGRWGWSSGVEVEWRALTWLGLAVEGDLASEQSEGFARPQFSGVRVAAAFSLFRDHQHERYLQAELGGRFLSSTEAASDPGDTGLPYSLILRGAQRWGRLTARTGLGVSLGKTLATDHALYAQGGLLAQTGRFGFWGAEVSADWRWGTGVVTTIAPEVGTGVLLGDIPFHVELALPWVYDSGLRASSLGAILRFVVEFDSD